MSALSSTPRRGFLGRLAAIAAAAGVGGLVPTRLAAEATADAVSNSPALDAWFARIQGKHRTVFDAPSPHDGLPAIWPRIYLNTMEATYPAPSTAVVILRHSGIPLALQDAQWAKYQLGEMFGIKDGNAPAVRNVYASITGLPIPGLGITELLKGGVLIGVCDVALTVNAGAAARRMNMAPEAVKADWVAGLIPGVQVVPSGVMAVGRAQELGCNYIFAG